MTSIKRPRLRVGVLGCGQIAQAAHFESCRKARNAELYAICDSAPDLLARMTQVHQPVRAFDTYDAMLADPELDAVIIAVADQFHAALAMQAMWAGKHVLIEKPMAVTVEEAEEIAACARATARVVQVGTMKRFDPGIAFAHDALRDDLGTIVALEAWYGDSTRRYAMTDATQPVIESSKRARRPDGDPKADRPRYYLLGHGSHLVDLARYLAGPIAAVRARERHVAGIWVWFVEVEFTSGAIGHLNLGIPYRSDWHEGFNVFAEHGSVTGKIHNPWYLKTAEVECYTERDGIIRRPLGEDGHVYRRQLEGFADTILTGVPQRGANAEDGLAAVRALVAIRQSAARDAWVRLDSVTGAV